MCSQGKRADKCVGRQEGDGLARGRGVGGGYFSSTISTSYPNRSTTAFRNSCDLARKTSRSRLLSRSRSPTLLRSCSISGVPSRTAARCSTLSTCAASSPAEEKEDTEPPMSASSCDCEGRCQKGKYIVEGREEASKEKHTPTTTLSPSLTKPHTLKYTCIHNTTHMMTQQHGAVAVR